MKDAEIHRLTLSLPNRARHNVACDVEDFARTGEGFAGHKYPQTAGTSNYDVLEVQHATAKLFRYRGMPAGIVVRIGIYDQ
jgi:hypothetical protein